MAQDQINFMHNTMEYRWVLLGRKLCQIMDQLRPKTGNPLEFFVFSLFYHYDVFLIFQTNIIMSHDNFNYMHNTNKEFWLLLESTLCRLIELIRKT